MMGHGLTIIYLASKGTFSSSITGSEDIHFGEFDDLVLSSDS